MSFQEINKICSTDAELMSSLCPAYVRNRS